MQVEIDKAIKPRVWLKSGGYLVINQTEALVSIDVNTGKFVGRGATQGHFGFDHEIERDGGGRAGQMEDWRLRRGIVLRHLKCAGLGIGR